MNANSVDPDQTPRSVASDLGLHYLPPSDLDLTCSPAPLLWDVRYKVSFYFLHFIFHWVAISIINCSSQHRKLRIQTY